MVWSVRSEESLATPRRGATTPVRVAVIHPTAGQRSEKAERPKHRQPAPWLALCGRGIKIKCYIYRTRDRLTAPWGPRL